MRPLVLIALLVLVGAIGCSMCSDKPVDPAARVCKHVLDVCGKTASYDACVASVMELRTVNLAAAEAAEACALAKKECSELATCGPRAGKNRLKDQLLHLRARASAAARGAFGEAAARVEEAGAKPQ